MPRTPFAWVEGQPHLIVNYDLEPNTLPSLPELLERLLLHNPPGHILLLRPLTLAEAALLHQVVLERDTEAWAQIVVKEEERFRGR